MPQVVVDYLSEQLELADPSCVKRYTERAKTRFEHMWEIRDRCRMRDFAEVEAELVAWVDARAWTTGDGPKAIFGDAVVWLRERGVLLPGVTTLARLVARVRDEATQRLWDTLCELLSLRQRRLLDGLLVVRDGARVCDLERWGRGPSRTSGPALVKALERVSEIKGVGVGTLDLGAVPYRRLVELARYGMGAESALLKRHGSARRLATLLATVGYLESKATDDALELLDVLMATELVGRAEREAAKEKLRRPRSARRGLGPAGRRDGRAFERRRLGRAGEPGGRVGGDRDGRAARRAAGRGHHRRRPGAAARRRRRQAVAGGAGPADRHRQLLGMALHRVVELAQATQPQGHVGRPRRVVERAPCRGDRGIHVLDATVGRHADLLLARRIDVRIRATRRRLDELAADQQPFL